jgi:hypothetical protein
LMPLVSAKLPAFDAPLSIRGSNISNNFCTAPVGSGSSRALAHKVIPRQRYVQLLLKELCRNASETVHEEETPCICWCFFLRRPV